MKALITLSNGDRIYDSLMVVEMLPERIRHLMRFHDVFERAFVDEWNKLHPHYKHKAVKAHILRN